MDYMNYLSELGLMAAVLLGFAVIALYVYYALAWQRIATNQKHPRPWLAWIPFANISLILQMGGFHWAWVFLILIPIAGLIAVGVLSIIAQWRIFEKAKYPGWLALSLGLGIVPFVGPLLQIAYFVVIGLVAWRKP